MDDHTETPLAHFDPELVPVLLRQLPQWVCWRYVIRDDRKTKCPFNAETGTEASSVDAETWTTFENAHAAYARDGYEGVGFVFKADGGLTGIDLDGCIDENGVLAPNAQELIDAMSSYSEVSPSQRGVKIFVQGTKPAGARCKSSAIEGFKATEVYDRARFFTVTSRHLSGTPVTVNDRAAHLEGLCAKLWPPRVEKPSTLPLAGGGFGGDDDRLIDKACSAANGAAFRRLFEGDTSGHGDDKSAADLALCNHLAFWTGRDADRMDRLFRRSGLMRSKWDEQRGERTYAQITIATAIGGCSAVYVGREAVEVPTALADQVSGVVRGDGLVPLGERDPNTGRLVLSPRCTLPTAQAYVREFHHHVDARTVHGYGGVIMAWSGNRYCEVEEEAIKHQLQPWLHEALRYVPSKRSGRLHLVPFESYPVTVRQALDTLKSLVYLSVETQSPAWLGRQTGPDRPPANELLPCRSNNLHIPTGVVIPATPALFTTNALAFDYDPDAPIPTRWLGFLEELFGGDQDAIELLQDWMGYCLIGDTSQQKMLLLVGPRRSGKGTIGRVIKQLVGAANTAGPTTGSLAGPFGLQPLIGKSLAIVSDARFSGENIATVVERLLCISGEDALTIDRKYEKSVTMKLATRFMFLTNELPSLRDASTALAGRFLVLQLKRSFYGQEDPTLTDRLTGELGGILLWAIEGWKRLRERGRFVQPESAAERVRELEDLASPVGAFVRECCTVGDGHRVKVETIYQAFTRWSGAEGRNVELNKTRFGKDLRDVVPTVSRRRGSHTPFYEGIRLREEAA